MRTKTRFPLDANSNHCVSSFIQLQVKCTVVFKGREVQHDNLGFELLEKLANDLSRFCTMEGKPKREGRSLACVIAPKPEVFRAINERKRLEEREARKKKEASKAEFLGKNSEKEFDSSAVSSIAIDEEYEDRYDDDDDSFEEDVDELLGEDNVTADLLG